MSNTIRVYHRDYMTGLVNLEGGWGNASGSHCRYWMEQAAERYAVEIGAKIQFDRNGNIHVLTTKNHAAIGRFYFLATSPMDIPLGEGWELVEKSGKLIFECTDNNDEGIQLYWDPMSQDDIDTQHGNDEFGGWEKPVISGSDLTPISLDDEGELYAVTLLMTDADKVMEMIDKHLKF